MYVKRKDLLLIAPGYNIFIVLIFACCVTAKLFPVLRCGAGRGDAGRARKQAEHCSTTFISTVHGFL